MQSPRPFSTLQPILPPCSLVDKYGAVPRNVLEQPFLKGASDKEGGLERDLGELESALQTVDLEQARAGSFHGSGKEPGRSLGLGTAGACWAMPVAPLGWPLLPRRAGHYRVHCLLQQSCAVAHVRCHPQLSCCEAKLGSDSSLCCTSTASLTTDDTDQMHSNLQ